METEKFTWTVLATKLLISQYENYEMLYNNKHCEYKNRNRRLQIYTDIALLINEVQKGCTAKEIKKKVNGLRSQYLAEKMKILKSKKSGAEGDAIYKPTAYWYPLLKFLEGTTNADDSQSNVDSHSSITDDAIGEVETALPDECTGIHPTHPPIKRKKQKSGYESLLLKAASTMEEMARLATAEPPRNIQNEDSLDIFGKFVSAELRGIQAASYNDFIIRMTKRKIQQALMDAWDAVDSGPSSVSSPVPCMSDSSQWPATTPLIQTDSSAQFDML